MVTYELNIFAIVILTSLLVVVYITNDTVNIKNRLFRGLIYTTIIMNVLEILSWVFNGLSGDWNYFFNMGFNALLTATTTIVVGLWACYIDFIMFKDYQKLKKKWYYFLPFFIMVVLSIINLFTPILFKIDTNNMYSRLPLIWISIFMTFLVYIYVLALVLKHATEYNRKVILGVLVFLSFPIIAAIIQLNVLGLMLIWPATALAILISYLIFETTSNARDYLTGIFTRERAEEQINNLIFRKKVFSVIMIDINNFKKINDTYGHHFGDKVLVFVSRVLQKVFFEKSIVSRYGGDEFLVVTELTDPIVLNQIKNEFIKIIESSEEPMKNLTLSYGVSTCYNPNKYDVEAIIIEADNNMYKNKAEMKLGNTIEQ